MRYPDDKQPTGEMSVARRGAGASTGEWRLVDVRSGPAAKNVDLLRDVRA